MRRAIGFLALLPVLALATACGGASKVTNEIVSAAEPRAALAAAAEAMSKESYYLEYSAEFEEGGLEGEEFDGTYAIARRGSDSSLWMRADDFEVAMIFTSDKEFACFSGDAAGMGFGADGMCMDFSSVEDDDEGSESLTEEINNVFFDTQAWLEEIAEDDELTIKEIDDRKIAGLDARCFEVKSEDDEQDGELCVSKESGVLVLLAGTFDGEEGSLRLKSTRDPKDSDFELPYEVTDFADLFGGLSDSGSFEDPAPKQDSKASIASRRIAGPLYEWEKEPALCPDLKLPEFGGLAALGDGRFIAADFDESLIVSADCKTQSVEIDGFDVAGIGDGRIYFTKSSFDGPTLVRRNADGSETVIAGASCDSRSVCKTGGEGKATEVVLDWVEGIAPAADGSAWFLESITDAKKNEPMYRLRHVSADGQLKTVETPKKIDYARLASGPNGGVYVLQFDNPYLLDASGKVVKDKLKLDSGCAAAGRDGDLWTYDMLDNDLQVRRADGTTKTFHFAPEESFFCQRIAVQGNGDLLVQSYGMANESGLWLVPNPLK